jgi:hypothetical protein
MKAPTSHPNPTMVPPPLQTSKRLRCWGQPPGGPTAYHEMIAKDKEVVKSVLLLTGSVEGIKSQVRGQRKGTELAGIAAGCCIGHPGLSLTEATPH